MKRSFLLCPLLFGLFLVASCQKENLIKPVEDVCTEMDDINFMRCCYSAFDVNHDGKVSMEEASAVSKINFYSKSIRSVKGIEYFTELTELYIDENKLASLDVSKNSKLQILECSSNVLTTLTISHNTSLTSLSCSYNELVSIDVTKNTSLSSLKCSHNQLTALDISNNSELRSLGCGYNQLTELDLSLNTELAGLNCEHNRLTVLDITSNLKLVGLNCSYNQLKELDLSNQPELYKRYKSGSNPPTFNPQEGENGTYRITPQWE